MQNTTIPMHYLENEEDLYQNYTCYLHMCTVAWKQFKASGLYKNCRYTCYLRMFAVISFDKLLDCIKTVDIHATCVCVPWSLISFWIINPKKWWNKKSNPKSWWNKTGRYTCYLRMCTVSGLHKTCRYICYLLLRDFSCSDIMLLHLKLQTYFVLPGLISAIKAE